MVWFCHYNLVKLKTLLLPNAVRIDEISGILLGDGLHYAFDIVLLQPLMTGLLGAHRSILPGSTSAIATKSPSPSFPAQHLILCEFADALRLQVAHLNRRDLVAVGDAACDLLPSGLDFL